MAPRVLSGPRGLVYATKGGQGPQLVGTFSSITWSRALGVQGAWGLGAFAAMATEYTDAELCQIQANGWRVVGAGPRTTPGVPKVQDLLLFEDMSIDVLDRVTKKIIAHFERVKPTAESGGMTAKQLSEFGVPMVGILMSDEEGPEGESPGAAQLP